MGDAHHIEAHKPDSKDHLRSALDLLCDVSRTCNDSTGLSVVCNRVLRRVMQFNGWTAGRVFLFDQPDAASSSRERLGATTMADRDGEKALVLLSDLGSELVGEVRETRSAVWQRTNFADDGRAFTAMCAPISLDELPIGAMLLAAPSRPPPSEIIRRAVESVAVQLAGVVERRHLDRMVASTISDEQARIGRELHDSVTQHLAGIALSADGLVKSLREDGRPEAEDAAQITSGVRSVVGELRDIIHGLLPEALSGPDLELAMRQRASDIAEQFGVEVRVTGSTSRVVREVGRTLAMVASEAMLNAARHAEASVIEVDIREHDGRVRLEVTDDGRGIDVGAKRHKSRGLTIMRHRAALVDGLLTIEPRDPGGTRVVCDVPNLREEEAEP